MNRELLNDRLCARGLDDRLGGYIILEAAKKAKERGCTCGIYAATTVGEELTKHGAARNVHIKYQWENGCGRNLYGRRCYSYGRQGDTYNSYVHTSSLYA